MHRTLIIRREYLHYVPKYDRYEKRHKNLAAHVSPAFRVEEGDQVTVGQCRPLSKTVCSFPFSMLGFCCSNCLKSSRAFAEQTNFLLSRASSVMHNNPY